MPRARAKQTEVIAPSLGLVYNTQTAFQDPRSSSNMKNARMRTDKVCPIPGYDTFGDPGDVLGVPLLIHEYVEDDGDTHLLLFTTKYIYEYNTTKDHWANIVSNSLLVDDCETTWTAVGAGVTTADDTTDFLRDSTSQKITIPVGFTTGTVGYRDVAWDGSGSWDYVHFWIKSDVTTAAGDLKFLLDETPAVATPTEYSIPALAAGVWTEVELALVGADQVAGMDSVGLKVDVDNGAQVINIDDIRYVDRYNGTEDNKWSVATYNNKLFATNDVDEIQVKAQSADFIDYSAAVSAGYKCRALASFRNHLILLNTIEGGTDLPSRYRWTDSGSEALSGGSAGSTDIDGAGEIHDSGFVGTKHVVYKDKSITTVSFIGGLTVFRFDPSIRTSGILTQGARTALEELEVFVSDNNVHLYAGGRELVDIGDQVRDEMFRIINDQRIARTWVYYDPHKQELYIGMATETNDYPQTVWVWHRDKKVWSRRERDDITAVGAFSTQTSVTYGEAVGTYADQTGKYGDRGSSSLSPIIIIADSSGVVNQIDETLFDDLSTAIEQIFDTPDLVAQSITVRGDESTAFTANVKSWMALSFEARGDEVEVSYSVDGGGSFNALQTVTLTTTHTAYYIPVNVTSQRIRFRFRNNKAAGFFELRWFAPYVIGRSHITVGSD